MRIKRIIRILTATLILAFCVYCLGFFILNPLNPEYLDCGKVISKSSDEIAIKHGSRTELYLNVQFNKTGFKSVECTPTTYFGTKVGESVCFNLSEEVSPWFKFKMLIAMGTIGVLCIIFLIWFITYLLP